MYRRANEAELLTKPALQEAHIPRLQLASSEQHERRRADLCLSSKKNPRLFAATHGMRMCRDNPAKESIEPARRDASLPTGQGFGDRCPEAIDVTPRHSGDVDLGGPIEMDEITLDLTP
jgi:hypothetical protein